MTSIMFWSSGFPVTEELLTSWHPLLSTLGRLLLGGIALVPLMLWREDLRSLRHAPWKRIFWISSAGLGLSTVCLNVGILYSDAVTAAILVTTMPIAAFILAVWEKEVKVTTKWVLGIALAVTGGVWASIGSNIEQIGFRGGEFFLVMATATFAWYSRETIKRLPMLSPVTTTSLTLIMGGLITAVFVVAYGALSSVDMNYDFSFRPVALLVWVSVVSNGVAMFFWLSAASRIGVTVASFHQNLVPFYVMIIAIIWGGDVVLYQILAALVVITGLAVTQWRGDTG